MGEMGKFEQEKKVEPVMATPFMHVRQDGGFMVARIYQVARSPRTQGPQDTIATCIH